MATHHQTPELHHYCRSAKNIPLPGARGVLLAKATCTCPCHTDTTPNGDQ